MDRILMVGRVSSGSVGAVVVVVVGFLVVVVGSLLLDLSPVVFVVLAGVAGAVLGDLRRKQK